MHHWPKFVYCPVAHCSGPLPGVCSAGFGVGVQKYKSGPVASVNIFSSTYSKCQQCFCSKGTDSKCLGSVGHSVSVVIPQLWYYRPRQYVNK